SCTIIKMSKKATTALTLNPSLLAGAWPATARSGTGFKSCQAQALNHQRAKERKPRSKIHVFCNHGGASEKNVLVKGGHLSAASCTNAMVRTNRISDRVALRERATLRPIRGCSAVRSPHNQSCKWRANSS